MEGTLTLDLTKQLATMKQQKTTKGPQRQAHEKEVKEMEKKVKRALRERHTAVRIVTRFKQAGLTVERKHQLLDAQRRLVSAFHERTLELEQSARAAAKRKADSDLERVNTGAPKL